MAATQAERFSVTSQQEYIHSKTVGTGHADTTKHEWLLHVHRDSYASYIGHHPMLAYFSVATNESIGRQRFNFMQKMILPVGLPAEKPEED